MRLLDHRIDVPEGKRDFPAYLDSNRFLSNLPGSTLLFPVVDLSRQYINGLMYLLTQPEGARPAIVDDRNLYRSAGVRKWVKSGFLNEDIKLPLGFIWAMRTQIEADLLLQNLMLTADAMGLGAWIHASIAPSIMLGDPKFRPAYGPMLDFDWTTPRWRPADLLRWQVPLPRYANLRATAVGLRHNGEHLIKAMCPPHYATMGDAVDAVVAGKFGPTGIYSDEGLFARIYRGSSAAGTCTRPAPTPPTSSRVRGTSAPTSTRPTGGFPPTATRSTYRACGFRPITSRTTTTSGTSAKV